MCETTWFLYVCGCMHPKRQHCITEPLKKTDKILAAYGPANTLLPSPPSLNGLHFPLPECRMKYAESILAEVRKEDWVRVQRLCFICRMVRQEAMNSIKPGTEEWPKRYDWKNWNMMGCPEPGPPELSGSPDSSEFQVSSDEEEERDPFEFDSESLGMARARRRAEAEVTYQHEENVENDGSREYDEEDDDDDTTTVIDEGEEQEARDI